MMAQKLKELMKAHLKKIFEQEASKYDGQYMVLKSLFDHPEYEVKDRLPTLQTEAYIQKDELLKKEFANLKINPAPAPQAVQLTSRDADAYNKIHD